MKTHKLIIYAIDMMAMQYAMDTNEQTEVASYVTQMENVIEIQINMYMYICIQLKCFLIDSISTFQFNLNLSFYLYSILLQRKPAERLFVARFAMRCDAMQPTKAAKRANNTRMHHITRASGSQLRCVMLFFSFRSSWINVGIKVNVIDCAKIFFVFFFFFR